VHRAGASALSERRAHGTFGVEAHLRQNESLSTVRRFATRTDSARTLRDLAIAWATEKRKAILPR